jgi:hypothetical protein
VTTEEPPGGASDPRLRFVWEEALRAVEHQASSLDDVRGRAAALLGAASIAAGFLASAALRDGGRFRAATWVGAVAFAMVGLLTANVLRPRKGWRLHREVSTLLSGYIDADEPADLDEMHRRLAECLEEDHGTNATKLDWLYRHLTAICAGLVVEILAFLWDLRGR